MNCGNSEKYSSSAFGFRPLIASPLSMTCAPEASAPSTTAVGYGGLPQHAPAQPQQVGGALNGQGGERGRGNSP